MSDSGLAQNGLCVLARLAHRRAPSLGPASRASVPARPALPGVIGFGHRQQAMPDELLVAGQVRQLTGAGGSPAVRAQCSTSVTGSDPTARLTASITSCPPLTARPAVLPVSGSATWASPADASAARSAGSGEPNRNQPSAARYSRSSGPGPAKSRPPSGPAGDPGKRTRDSDWSRQDDAHSVMLTSCP